MNTFTNIDAITQLSFDPAAMTAGLRRWVECESPTYERAAVNAMMDLASRDLAVHGADIQRIPGRMGFGDCVKANFPHERASEPGILILGHLDTVHPIGTLEQLPWQQEGERCYGPGSLDMKGGNYIALAAIARLQQEAIATRLPVSVLFVSDEEVGSPSTRDLIEAEAARHKYILVPEPARRNGGVTTGRYAIARFELTTRGQPSHAGHAIKEGVSAIREMALQIPAIEDMADDETGFSVGVVDGGRWVNCVSTTCHAKVLVSATTNEKLDSAIQRMHALKPRGAGVDLEVKTDVIRPVWTQSDRSLALYEHAAKLADTLGFDIPPASSGGGSDGNFTGALGFATLDGLGVRGDNMHTLNEYIVMDSLPERARLMAGLLATLE